MLKNYKNEGDKDKNQPSIADLLPPAQKYKVTSEKKRQYDRKLVLFAAKDMWPMTIADGDGFRELMEFADPRYQCPSRQHLTSTLLPQVYDEEKQKLKAQLERVEWVSTTTDCWTSVNNTGFMAITIHFYDAVKQQLATKLLSCKVLHGSHTGVAIREEHEAVAEEFGVKDKLVAVTTDCASNNVLAFKETPYRWVPCLAHRLNTAVQKSVKRTEMLPPLIRKIKDVVLLTKRSTLEKARFHATQSGMEMPHKGLKLDVKTRWNSLYEMLERAQEQRRPINVFIADRPATDEANELVPLRAGEWDTIRNVVKLLEPLLSVTEAMSGQKYTTSALTIPLAKHLTTHYVDTLNLMPEEDPCHELCENLANFIPAGVADSEKIYPLAMATLLDPRFKDKSFVDEGQMLYYKGELLNEYKEIMETEPEVPAEEAEPIEDVHPAGRRRVNIWAGHDSGLEVAGPRMTGSMAEDKNNEYFERSLLPRHADPVKWWANQGRMLYPILSRLAFKYLSVPGTSVPSERTFSAAGNIITKKRNRLTDENAKMLIFINANCDRPAKRKKTK